MALTSEAQTEYVKIIDTILASSDLNTISEKRIRKGLQQVLNYDITPQKDVIKPLIMARFDRFIADQSAPPKTNGHLVDVKKESGSPEATRSQTSAVPTSVHKRESTEIEESSEAIDPVPPKKKRKRSPEDDDAAFAAKLQAEENIRARPTRGGGPKKAAPVKKQKMPKKKMADRVDVADDSDLDSEAAEKRVNRSGGFHKPLTLSAPLSALLDGQLQLSRPQTVKQIWEYVRRHDLQDPSDKRWIRCDDALKAVFKSEKDDDGVEEGEPVIMAINLLATEVPWSIREGEEGEEVEPPPGFGGGGTFGVHPTKDADPIEGVATSTQHDGDVDEDTEVCFICASQVVHNAIAPCNHGTCHICALRLRALYKTRACAHCRTEAQHVIFTDNPAKRYEDFVDSDFQEIDEVLGIKYEQKEIHNDTILLLRYNCPDASCDIACWGWPDLHRHVKGAHHKVMCDLCTRNKKVFTHEHELFTIPDLKKHEKFGDDNPGAIDQSGFKGHPECGFCRHRFYGDDELYAHCRDKHERCHICDRRNGGRQQQYYVDYNSLEQHFREDHYACIDQECLEKKFVVFDSELDLKAHQLQAHPNGLSKDARRDARLVDISSFDYRAPYQESRGGRRDRQGGRGRDPNTEALPQSTAQPLRRDELAYQRQMAIQSAQSVAPRTFGGQLTSTTAVAARPNQRQEPITVTATHNSTTTNTSFPAIDNLNLNTSHSPSQPPASPTPLHALTPQEQARRLHHTSVMDRASTLLKHDPAKISSFRTAVSTYRSSTLSATQLIDNFFSLFDVPASDLGKLIKELADIYENESKRNDLLKAWNDWRAINEDYPSLPGPSGVLPGSSAAMAGSGGYRVLKLKNSTTQSSKSAVSRHGSWGNATGPNPFPTMPASVNRAGAGKVGPTPWASSGSSSPRPASAAPPARRMPVAQTNGSSSASEAFPALPAAAKPSTLMAGLTRSSVRWDDTSRRNVNASPWANGSAAQSSPPTAGENQQSLGEEVDGVNVVGKKKGKANKKQTLYKFG
ncbi:MAG: hypothetical protein Q9166_003390 [cf. Caloplaca sp. 2 TL-2023]